MNKISGTICRWTIFILVLSFIIPGLGSQADEIKIGALLPVTGSLSSLGIVGQAAVKMAEVDLNGYFERINSSYRIHVVIEDTRTDPTQTQAALQTFYNQGIRFVIGPYDSDSVAAVKDFADRNGIILLSPSSSSVSLSLPGDNLYRMSADDSNQGLAIASYLSNQKMVKVIPIHMDESFGNSLFLTTKTNFEGLGGSYSEGVKFDPAATDYAAWVNSLDQQVEQASSDGSAVAVHLIAFDQSIGILREAGKYPALKGALWVGNDGITQSQELLDDAEAASFAAAVKFISPIFRRDDAAVSVIPTFPQTQHFMKKMRAQLGRNGDDYSTNAYDAVWVGAFTYALGDSTNSIEALRSAFMHSVNLIRGYFGEITFNNNGDRNNGIYGFYTVLPNPAGGFFWKVTASFRFANGKPNGKKPLLFSTVAILENMGEITIPVLAPLTGSLSQIGQSAAKSMQFAVADFNAFLEDEGSQTRIRLDVNDTQTDPTVALNLVKTLDPIATSHVVVGPYASSCLEAVKEDGSEKNLIFLSPSSSVTSLAIPNDNVYRLVFDNGKESEAIASLLQANQIKTVIPFWRNDDYGIDLKNALTIQFATAAISIAQDISYELNPADFSDKISKLADAVSTAVTAEGKDRVAVILISYEEAADIFALASQYDILKSILWMGCDSNARLDSVFSDNVVLDFVQKTRFCAPIFAPDYGISDRTDPPQRTIKVDFQNFVTEFVNTFHQEPEPYDYGSYDAVWIAAYSNVLTGENLHDPKAVFQQFQRVAYVYLGYSGLSNLNAAGDKNYGSIGFTKIIKGPTGYHWDYFAGYQFSVLNGNYLVIAELQSGIINWELY